jgi:ABC-type bacteriocin/lantibiotic exporter with double-glycine peptidase domain
MGSFERSPSMASEDCGLTLGEALSMACPESTDVLRTVEEEADPFAALRAAGFRVVTRHAVPVAMLRFVRSAVAQCESGWLVLSGGRRGVVARGRGCSTIPMSDAAALITGPIIEIERPLETESIVRALVRQAFEERSVIMTVVTATCVAPLLALVPAAASLYVFDEVIPNELRGGMTLVAVALLATAFFQAWVSIVRVQTLLYVRARLDLGVARRLLARTLRLPFTHLQKFSAAGLMEAFRGLSNARDILADRVLSAGFDGAMSLLILIAVFWFSPPVALLLAIGAFGYLLIAAALAYAQMRHERQEIQARMATRERLIDAIRAVATVKSAGAEEAMVKRWQGRLSRELLVGSRRQRLVLYSGAVRDAMRQSTTFGVLIAGALLIGSGATRIGSFVALLQLTGAYVAGVLGAAGFVQSLMTAIPHLQRAAELSRIDPVPRARRTTRPERIVLEKVSFRYTDDGPWVLRGLDAVIEPGCIVRLDGPSGAGKTTVLRLLASIYEPTGGRLHVNGIDLDRGGSAFLYLPQDVQLFAGSVLDNLRLLSGGAPVDRILRASEDLGLAAWVSSLPMAYATLVMSGASISGGQKQLIALTAAAATDVPVLLLDEAGSNLDAATYRRVFASPVWQGRTIIYVGHSAYAQLPGSLTLSVTASSSAVS